MKRWLIGITVVVVLGIGVWWLVTPGEEATLRTATATKTDVVQDVSFTGRVVPQEAAVLSFELAGVVQEVSIEVGDTVAVGDALLAQDPATVELELAAAQADLASAKEQAKLVWQADRTAQQQLTTENEETRLKKRQAVIDAKAEVDQAEVVYQRTSDANGDEAVVSETALATLRTKESAYHAAQQALAETLETINKTNQAAIDATALSRAKYLATTQAASNVSGLSTLAATQELAKLRVAKSQLVSPLAGVVTAVELEVGEFAAAGQAVVTVATVDQLKLTAAVPETDATKVAVDQAATITFDALPITDEFVATVSHVAPAATLIEGVPTYTVELLLAQPEQRLKPGLTANVIVHIERRASVVAVPRRAVARKGATQTVQVVQPDGSAMEQEVQTGLVGSDGQLEITRGVAEGDQVVVSVGNE